MSPSPGQVRLSRKQIREIDRRAIEEYGIPGLILMENAGRNAARIIRGIFEEHSGGEAGARPLTFAEANVKGWRDSRNSGTKVMPTRGAGFVAIVCGRGNNGGDGFVIARHVANVDIPVELFLACDPASLIGDAATNYAIVERMGLPRHKFDAAQAISANKARLAEALVVVDAVLGTGFSGDVRSPIDLVIEAINGPHEPPSSRRVVAIDVPSGLDCDTGRPSNATVRADVTVTFVARKLGFDAPGALDYTGRVIVTYIGAPPRLIDDVRSGGKV